MALTKTLPNKVLIITALPLNINDGDPSLELTRRPVAREGITEMTLSLIRYEIISTIRKMRPSLLVPKLYDAETGRITQECSKKLETRYLRNCTMNIPFHWFIATVARMMVAKMWISIHHRSQLDVGVKVLPTSCKDRIFTTSLEVVEVCLLLDREESAKQW